LGNGQLSVLLFTIVIHRQHNGHHHHVHEGQTKYTVKRNEVANLFVQDVFHILFAPPCFDDSRNINPHYQGWHSNQVQGNFIDHSVNQNKKNNEYKPQHKSQVYFFVFVIV
jgi:hypothetical protein